MSKNCNVWHRKPRPTKKLRHCAPCFTTRCKRGWDFDRCFAGLREQLWIEFQHVRNAFWGGKRRGGEGPVDSCGDSLVYLLAASILIHWYILILPAYYSMWAAFTRYYVSSRLKEMTREDLIEEQSAGVRCGRSLKLIKTENYLITLHVDFLQAVFVQTCFRRLFRTHWGE